MRLKFAMLAILVLFAPGDGRARVPKLLNYQGQIASRADGGLDTLLTVTFGIYAVPEGGTPLWSETQIIAHDNGVFHALLGSQSPLPEGLFSSDQRYLEIRLANEAPFRPRQRIVSVAFALEAARAENATGHLTPHSLSIGAADIDTSGALTAPQIRTDSLVIGNRGVIDRQGKWTGAPLATPIEGMLLDTMIVRNVQASLSFGSVPWSDVDGTTDVLTAFISLKKPAFLDAQFHTTASATGGLFETRLVIEPIDPRGSLMTAVGNISRFEPKAPGDFGPLSNQAVAKLDPGLYRVFVQGRVDGQGTLQTGILTIRAYK